MKLQTKTYDPIDTSIWLDYDMDSLVGDSNLVIPGSAKMPPFVHATVLAAGPGCKQVKNDDIVLVNSSTIMRLKVSGHPEVLFTQENKIVAIVKPASLEPNGVNVLEFAGN
jgi:hypothetical protein